MHGSTSYEDLAEVFRTHGGTPELYLSNHFQRFTVTLEEFRSTWTPQ